MFEILPLGPIPNVGSGNIRSVFVDGIKSLFYRSGEGANVVQAAQLVHYIDHYEILHIIVCGKVIFFNSNFLNPFHLLIASFWFLLGFYECTGQETA